LGILQTVGALCVAAALIGWIVNVARGRTTVRAAFYDKHGPRPAWAGLLALAAVIAIAIIITLVTG
jgi:hypothetical protein